MKKALYLLPLFTIALLLTACGSSKTDLLKGAWNEQETGTSVLHYNEDGTFEHHIDNGEIEKGTWRVDGDLLYTTNEGEEIEYTEKITVLDEENLVLNIADMFETKYKRKK